MSKDKEPKEIAYYKGYSAALRAHLFDCFESACIETETSIIGSWQRTKEWETKIKFQFEKWFLDRFGVSGVLSDD